MKFNRSRIIHHYNEDHNTRSAQEIIPYLLNYIKPESIIDIGCGLGQWLKIFEERGVKRIVGVDGNHVPKDKIFINPKFFIEANLEDIEILSSILDNEKFDLAINLEVAEHLKPQSAKKFIDFITSLSDTILFSAAIPNQTGENHFNEQNHDYWQKLFAKKDYVFLDVFREKLWSNAKINWWYRQNMFLVVRKGTELSKIKKQYNGNVYIHPELLNLYVNKQNVQQVDTSIKSAFKSLIKAIFKINK